MFECIPDTLLGLPILPLLGLVFGTLIAVNEAVRTKFRKAELKVESEGKSIKFDYRYVVTAVIGIIVVALTVVSVKDAGLLNPLPNTTVGFTVAMSAGFTEGWAVIRALNSRLDVMLKSKENKDAESEKTSNIDKAVEFVEVEESKEEPKVSFEEL